MHNERPVIFSSETELPAGTEKKDTLESALTELFFIDNPQVSRHHDRAAALQKYKLTHPLKGVWAYYPFRKKAVRIPSEETYYRIRTARNRFLISDEEQALFRSKAVAIAGLSVGSLALSALVATGGPKKIKIADPDTLDISNLNRIRATLLDVGDNKTDIAARAAWEVDPFLDLELWRDGIQEASLLRFFNEPRVDVYVDEMDAVALKITSRAVCKKLRIPVVMATDNGDSVIVDIERFDLEPERPLFHGRISFGDAEITNMGPEHFIDVASKIIDPIMFTERQQASIREVGTTLAGVPQLGSAAMLAGAAAAYAVRAIATGATLPSGRYGMGCEACFAAPTGV